MADTSSFDNWKADVLSEFNEKLDDALLAKAFKAGYLKGQEDAKVKQ